jgi:hypothetical protein
LTRTTTETLFQWKSLTAPGEAGLFAFVPPEGAQLAAAPEK